jgi:chorismate mutase
MDAEFGRFQVPEERPFSKRLPHPKRKAVIDTDCLSISNLDIVNLGDDIRTSYLDILPRLCNDNDDGHYGSSIECDVSAVQSISRRIHYGSFYIAECKFRDSQEEYTGLIKNNDCDGLLERLTRKDIEDQITTRIYDKICSIQRDVNQMVRQIIEPEIIVTFYKDIIIPLTKRGELLYLMNRQFD